MKYLQISNTGLIEPEALTLIGASSKRGDKSKIGMFGSGNKYALSFFLRNNYNFRIYTNGVQVKIGTVKKIFREDEYDVLAVEGVETSITTEMGHKWKLWHAIREFYSNAVDEGLTAFKIVEEMRPRRDHTDLFIEVNEEIDGFMNNFMDYIALNNISLWESEIGKIYLKHESKTCVYRKGIRCYDANKESIFDYDLNNIAINENRIVEYYWDMYSQILKMFFTTPEVVILETFLQEYDSSIFESGLFDSIVTKPAIENQETWRKALDGRYVCPEQFKMWIPAKNQDNTICLPSELATMLIKQVPGVKMPFSFKSIGSYSYIDHEMTALQLDTLKRVEYFFKECSFKMPYKVKAVKFENPDVYGTVKKEVILISAICLDKGPHEVANTIIEEFVHIKYNANNETRKFQACLIDEFLMYMKNKNAINI